MEPSVHFDHPLASDPQPLASTRVGLHLREFLPRVTRLGHFARWEPGGLLCRKGETEEALHLIFSGRIRHPGGWLGAGAHVGELGFLLGVPRSADVVAESVATGWSIRHRDLWKDPAAGTHLVSALLRELPNRLKKFDPPPVPEDEFCDAGHPAIVALARALGAGDGEATARSIWEFVRALPYRFGPWWQRASDTLRQGWGMCTTKTNLQVALWRAAGLEAGFVEMQGSSDLIHPLIPEGWKASLKPSLRHFVGAVRLEGRWHVAEASFTDPLLDHFARAFPDLHGILPPEFGVGKPFHPLAYVTGGDPFAAEVRPAITHAMARRSSFDADQLELLNLTTDTLQPPVTDESAWLIRARERLGRDPEGALRAALAAAAVIAADLKGHFEGGA
jgi:hypothetical protein